MKRHFIGAVAAIGCAFAVSGCAETHEIGSERYPFDHEDIQYLQDPRTDLCFAYTGVAASNPIAAIATGTMAEVPCTPEVLQLIENQP